MACLRGLLSYAVSFAMMRLWSMKGIHTHTYVHTYICIWASQMALAVKNPPGNAGNEKDVSSIPGSGRFPGVGNGNLLQCAWLENFTDTGGWQATVHGVAKSWTQLSTHTFPTYYLIWHRKPLQCIRLFIPVVQIRRQTLRESSVHLRRFLGTKSKLMWSQDQPLLWHSLDFSYH